GAPSRRPGRIRPTWPSDAAAGFPAAPLALLAARTGSPATANHSRRSRNSASGRGRKRNLGAQVPVVGSVGLPDEAVGELVADEGLSVVVHIREEDLGRRHTGWDGLVLRPELPAPFLSSP